MKKQDQGFTIIEVVLVLAIAGLIFLIVFLALPQLQRSRRDTQRRSDVGAMMAALDSYAANKQGRYPTDMTEILPYLPEEIADPASGSYDFPTTESTGGSDWQPPDKDNTQHPAGYMIYSTGAQCNGDYSETATGDKKVAVVMQLETGRYCQDNT